MTRHWTAALALGACCAGGPAGFAADWNEAAVQGLYEGSWKGAEGEAQVEGRLIALGDSSFMLLVRDTETRRKVRLDMEGKAKDGALALAGRSGGDAWTAAWSEGKLEGRSADPARAFRLARVEKKPPTLGKEPPPGAVVLLDGKSFEEMIRPNAPWFVGEMSRDGHKVWEVPVRTIAPDKPDQWPSAGEAVPKGWALGAERRHVDSVLGIPGDGSVQIPKGGMMSRRVPEGSFDLHVEFQCNFVPAGRSQGRGNSGVFLPCGTEVQVLDSFGMPTYLGGGCGGLYKFKDPDAMDAIDIWKGQPEHAYSLASLPPLAWQAYDIEYRVRGEGGAKAAFLTVVHNGVKIHDNVKLEKKTGKQPFQFQDHGNPVRFRNIWYLPAP